MNFELNENQQKLVEDNFKLVYWQLNKMNINIEDYWDVAAIGLCKAAAIYDESRGIKFSTLACKAIRNEVIRERIYESRHRCDLEIPLSEVVADHGRGDTPITLEDTLGDTEASSKLEYYEIKDTMNRFKKKLSARELEIVHLLESGNNQTEIGKITNRSKMTICKDVKRIREKYLKFICVI